MSSLLDLLKAHKETAPIAVSDFVPVVPTESVVAKTATTEDEYFSPDGYISRSELLGMKAQREGRDLTTPDFVFRSGKMFDCYFTEPHLWRSQWADEVSEFELLQILKAKKQLFAANALPYTDEALASAIDNEALLESDEFAEFQVVKRTVLETPFGQIKVKAKADWLLGSDSVVDYKSTTKQSLSAFMKDIERYNLDLQAAWYSDIFGIRHFQLVVCSYIKSHHIEKALLGIEASYRALIEPSKVWVINMDSFIEKGREKYLKLLKEAIEAGQIEVIKPTKKKGAKQ